MTRIELSEKESAVLIEILESFLYDLKTERVRTEKREYRMELTQRGNFVEDLITRLRVPGTM